jgi:ATP-binding cassette subfamily B protein
LRILSHYAKGAKGLLLLSLIASVLSIGCYFLMPQVILLTVDSVIGEADFRLPDFLLAGINQAGLRAYLRQNLVWCLAVILLFDILSGFFTYLRRASMAKGAEGIIRRLRIGLYGHIQRLPYLWHAEHKTGDILQRCTADVDVIRLFISGQALELFRAVSLVILALAVMFTMNIKMTLAAAGFLPLIAIYSYVFYGRIAKRFRAADEAEGELSAAVQENLSSVRVVRAFGRERYEVERFDAKNLRFTDLWMRLGYVLGLYWGLGDLLTGLQVMTVVGMGALLSTTGELTMGQFLAFVSYNAQLVWPIRGLGRILSEMSKAGVSLDRIGAILTYPAEDSDEAEPSEVESSEAAAAANGNVGEADSANGAGTDAGAAGTEADDELFAGDIAFDIRRFAYPGGKPILRDIRVTIPGGSTLGILGGTGTGKSTLMHLLDRLYDLPPAMGRITVGGVDIQSLRRRRLRRHIGFALQEPFLFSRTIRENISAFRPGAPLAAARRAAAIACVDGAIEGFADGYDTMVGERGVTLSGGQKQRVAIARMLTQQAPIMIFDDSLSAVDGETDARIRASLRENLGRATVILISHRVATLMTADNILVLDNGQVTEMGTHAELLAREGIYRRVFDIQGGGEVTPAGGELDV